MAQCSDIERPSGRSTRPGRNRNETSAPNTGSFIVQLSEAFTNVVTVNLTTLPVNNLTNGTIVLSANQVVFGVGETEKTVRFSARDGTVVRQRKHGEREPCLLLWRASHAHRQSHNEVIVRQASGAARNDVKETLAQQTR